MGITPIISIAKSEVFQDFRLLFKGLDEIERSLQETKFIYPLNALWTFDLFFKEASLDEEPAPETDEMWASVNITATALESEYHGLSNIWSRKMGLKLSVQTVNGTVICEDRDTEMDIYCPTSKECPHQNHNDNCSLRWGWNQFVKYAEIFDNAEVKRDDAFVMVFSLHETQSQQDVPKTSPGQLRLKLCESLASQLLDPTTGDVAIEVFNKESGMRERLYAWKHILSVQSEYFSARLSPVWNPSVAMSGTSEKTFSQNLSLQNANRYHDDIPDRHGQSSNASETSTSSTVETTGKGLADSSEPMLLDSRDADSSTSPRLSLSEPVPELRSTTDSQGRCVIYIDNVDFITMHNILYYLYTGHVNMHIEGGEVRGRYEIAVHGYPEKVDAFDLFRAANMFLLEDLEERCHRFLIATCTPNNICPRLLSEPLCKNYEKLKGRYLEYILQHYDAVKMTPEWENMILNLSNCSPEMAEYQSQLLLEISRMTFGVK